MNAMKPTHVGLLAAVAVVSAAVGWGLVQVVDARAGRLLPVPWLAAAALWLLAGAVAWWAVTSRPRLQRRPGAKPMPPLVAARTAALAMAGSASAPWSWGSTRASPQGWCRASAPRRVVQTFWAATLAAVGALGLVAASLWLEHLCRLPVGPSDGPPA